MAEKHLYEAALRMEFSSDERNAKSEIYEVPLNVNIIGSICWDLRFEEYYYFNLVRNTDTLITKPGNL